MAILGFACIIAQKNQVCKPCNYKFSLSTFCTNKTCGICAISANAAGTFFIS